MMASASLRWCVRATSPPLELVEAALARIAATNPTLNAVVLLLAEQARAATHAPLADGPFAGVPMLL